MSDLIAVSREAVKRKTGDASLRLAPNYRARYEAGRVDGWNECVAEILASAQPVAGEPVAFVFDGRLYWHEGNSHLQHGKHDLYATPQPASEAEQPITAQEARRLARKWLSMQTVTGGHLDYKDVTNMARYIQQTSEGKGE